LPFHLHETIDWFPGVCQGEEPGEQVDLVAEEANRVKEQHQGEATARTTKGKADLIPSEDRQAKTHIRQAIVTVSKRLDEHVSPARRLRSVL
jgi:hypothetical protein